jgi:hypothetical protein
MSSSFSQFLYPKILSKENKRLLKVAASLHLNGSPK